MASSSEVLPTPVGPSMRKSSLPVNALKSTSTSPAKGPNADTFNFWGLMPTPRRRPRPSPERGPYPTGPTLPPGPSRQDRRLRPPDEELQRPRGRQLEGHEQPPLREAPGHVQTLVGTRGDGRTGVRRGAASARRPQPRSFAIQLTDEHILQTA